MVRVASAYMPNGNPIGTDKFTYKLAWLERLEDWARAELMQRRAARHRRRLQHHP